MNKDKTVLELGFGISIKDAADLAIKLAQQNKSGIVLSYNKVNINISPDTTPNHVVNAFFSKAATMPNMAMQQQIVR